MININEASYSYKRSLENQLKKISIKINQGEVILLCGKSGSGKTTITKLINGLIPHFLEGNLLGNIFINGINTKQMKIYEISEKVGTIFQNPKTQFFNLDSDSELTFGLENLGENPDKIKRQVFKVVRDLEIERLKNRNVFMMSGGEKQLLAIASIYATNPDVYVFDEPSANIDEYGIAFVRKKNDDFANPVTFCESDDFVVSNLEYENKKQKILDKINISGNKGDIIAITGKNGQGKTTLMRILCGLLKENEGKISYKGSPIKYKKRRKLCYMVMQDVIHQFFSESVRDEFSLFDSKIDEKQIDNILEKLDLKKLDNRHPMCLSGGQMQRLSVALGMLMDREIIILDEPTSGLDYTNMLEISKVIKEFSNNKIIFIVTHDNELIDSTCNKLLEICDGRIKRFYERR